MHNPVLIGRYPHFHVKVVSVGVLSHMQKPQLSKLSEYGVNVL